MKLRHAAAALSSAAALSLGLGGTATAHDTTGFLCYGNVSPFAAMYNAGGGAGSISAYLYAGEAFRGHVTQNFGGVFWSYGHSASSFPYDHWVRTQNLRC